MATLFSVLATRVVSQLGNRTDLTSASQNAVADAVGNLCASWPFEELEVTGPNVNLTANVDTYLETDFITAASGDVIQKIMDIMVYTDSAPTQNSASTPAPWVPMDNPDYKRQDKIPPISIGQWPTQWARISSNASGVRQLLFRSVPNATWTVFMRYQRMHPFTSTYPYSTTPLLLTFEWEYVIVQYATAIVWQGYLKESDRAQAMLLFLGLKRDEQGNYIPGLIQSLMSRRQREYPQNTQSIDMPQQQCYSATW